MNIDNMKASIENLKAVKSCGIVLDENSQIEEIHVVTNFERNPKQVSRDIQSVLKSMYETDVDYKKISIAQLENFEVAADETRLKLNKIEYSSTDSITEVKIILEKDQRIYESIERGAATKYGINRLLANCTLKAAESFLVKDHLFTFEELRVIPIAQEQVVLVSIVLYQNNDEKKLYGCAKVGKDMNEAIVRATLCAINRKVALMNRDKN